MLTAIQGIDINSDDGKLQYLSKAAVIGAEANDVMTRDLYIGRLSDKYGVSRTALETRVNDLRKKKIKQHEKKVFDEIVHPKMDRSEVNPEKRMYPAAVAAEETVLAVLLQFFADKQMHAYRKNRTTPFIRVGLWKYSRHPNYLGEILMWWGIAFYAVVTIPSAWWLLAGAITNTVLFLTVSIPMADGRQSKKEGFDEYKKHTRMLLPIYKK